MSDRERELSADEREKALDLREVALDKRVADAESILKAAEERDADAEERDGVAIRRDREEDLRAFLDPGDKPYGNDAPGRRVAAMARKHAKGDRNHSADDRARLTQQTAQH